MPEDFCVRSDGQIWFFDGCEREITPDGYLIVYALLGPNKRKKREIMLFNEWTHVGEQWLEKDDGDDEASGEVTGSNRNSGRDSTGQNEQKGRREAKSSKEQTESD